MWGTGHKVQPGIWAFRLVEAFRYPMKLIIFVKVKGDTLISTGVNYQKSMNHHSSLSDQFPNVRKKKMEKNHKKTCAAHYIS